MGTSSIQSELRAQGSRAREADSLRVQGIHSEAIERFNDVLREEPANAWAYAHRGDAKASIFELEGAVADFDKAIEIRRSEGRDYAWAHAHKGEAYRLYTRFYMWRTDRPLVAADGPGMVDLLQRSDDCFETALAQKERYPWALAHHAATYTYKYVIARHILRRGDEECDRYVEMAVRRFEEAQEAGAVYSWAYTFKAFVLMMANDPNRAPGLSDGGLVGMDRRLMVLEPLSALRNFGNRHPEAARCGWLRLQEDPHAVIASYFTASSVAAQSREGGGQGKATAEAVIRQAQAILRHREILARTLRAALDYQLDGNNLKPLEDALTQLKASPDLETYVLINLDSSLRELREEQPDWFKPHAA